MIIIIINECASQPKLRCLSKTLSSNVNDLRTQPEKFVIKGQKTPTHIWTKIKVSQSTEPQIEMIY